MAKKVLLVRLDKIGDLISTLCVDQAPFMRTTETHWVISTGLGFVPDHASPTRTYSELDRIDWKTSLPKLRELIRKLKPDVAVSFHCPWWVNYAFWAEKVPVRAGVRSQWHSFLFLNKGLRQKRSRATQHEADYNMDLLIHAMGENPKAADSTPVLTMQAPANEALLEKHHLQRHQYLVIHPGMAGSALNWPTERYIALIRRLLPETKIVITGTPADEKWLTEIKATFTGQDGFLCLQSQLSSSELLTVLANAHAVVAPSTGVAHMAASLGTRTVGLYSPVKVQHPRRWRARGPHVKILMGHGRGPEEKFMEHIQVDDVLIALGSFE